MKFIESMKRIYQCFAENRIVVSVFFGGYFIVQKLQNKECRKSYRKTELYSYQTVTKNKLDDLCVAAICDDMTWQNLKQECKAFFLTPHNWKSVLSKTHPDVFFCESAWLGIKEHGNCWHGKIYRNKKLLFENRKELLEILSFCKEHRIPTVFWNKEDPAFINSEKYDFKDTALKFDYIFTTAKECVEVYQKHGHERVDILPFGFSPYLFNPLDCYPKENNAVFAGSWYEEETKRCKDLSEMFEKVISNQIPLVIYDRQLGTTKEGRVYPQKYQTYVKGMVPFEKLGGVLKKAKYAINVNTIETSETMFARRVLEFMAMNTFIISNNSVGMKQLFSGKVSFLSDELPIGEPIEACLKNMEYVFKYRTNKILLSEVFRKVGVLGCTKSPEIAVTTISKIYEEIPEEYDYVFLHDGESELPDFELMIPHFCYLPKYCGIKVSRENEFVIQKTIDNKNVLFPKEMFREVVKHPEQSTKKYLLGISAK